MHAHAIKTRSSETGGGTGANGPTTAPVRVLHLNAGNLYGGVETLLTTLARLRQLCPGMEPHFGLCYEGRLSRELEASGAPVYLLGAARLSRPWTVWQARGRVRDLIRRISFDLVVCHMPWSLAVFGPALKASGQRLGMWAHSSHAGTGWLERMARRTPPDIALANSRFTAAGLVNLFPRTPKVVVHPPVALAPPSTGMATRSSLRGEFGANDGTAVIVQVSRIERCKGHLVHLRALAKLTHLKTPWVCWIVGGPQRPEEHAYLGELQQLASRLGLSERVRFLGQRDDVAGLLAAADIFCQPNETPDSFGISFIEALAAGCPVVTSTLGGALEIVDDSCWRLVKPGDVDGLAASLAQLIEYPEVRHALGRQGASRASELCDPASQMTLLYQLAKADNTGAARS